MAAEEFPNLAFNPEAMPFVPGLDSGTIAYDQMPTLVIPSEQQLSLSRTLRIAGMVGDRLSVNVVDSERDIPPQPGVYLIDGSVDSQHHDRIAVTKFKLEPRLLSGKTDSSHAVLPGGLTVSYAANGTGDIAERNLYVAAKGYYKRLFPENLERVKTEIEVSRLQEKAGEIAFKPVAVVIADPPYQGRGTDSFNYDLLLVTRLEGVTTLDNTPWQLGSQEPRNLRDAELAVSALGRLNRRGRRHNDSKIKNFAQDEVDDTMTSAIDFEATEEADPEDPHQAAVTVDQDLGLFLESLLKRDFFSQAANHTRTLVEDLCQTYLCHWDDLPSKVQNVVFERATRLSNSCVQQAVHRQYQHARHAASYLSSRAGLT